MWFFPRKKDGTSRRRVIRRIIVGFIIGGAISSIIGKKLLSDRRKEHLGEERSE